MREEVERKIYQGMIAGMVGVFIMYGVVIGFVMWVVIKVMQHFGII